MTVEPLTGPQLRIIQSGVRRELAHAQMQGNPALVDEVLAVCAIVDEQAYQALGGHAPVERVGRGVVA